MLFLTKLVVLGKWGHTGKMSSSVSFHQLLIRLQYKVNNLGLKVLSTRYSNFWWTPFKTLQIQSAIATTYVSFNYLSLRFLRNQAS